MSLSINKVTLIGHLGADPEIRSFQNGGRVANLRVATSESWKDKGSGEKRERTEWHSVSITADGLVGVIEKYFRKGVKVYIEGQLKTRKWQDKDGNDRYSTEVAVVPFDGKVINLSPRPNDRDGGGYGGGGYGRGGSDSGGQSRDIDDEIPF